MSEEQRATDGYAAAYQQAADLRTGTDLAQSYCDLLDAVAGALTIGVQS